MTASETLAAFASGLRFEDVPPGAVRAAKRHMLDALGVALAAAASGAITPAVEALRSWAGAREAGVLGHDFAAPAPWAAFANGALAHALDFDDTHVESVVHASAFVLATALAVGEESGGNGRDVVAGAVAGYEVATRIGAAAPGRFHARGLHPTGLCGPFGAAAAAGRIWGLGPGEIADALGIAGSQSAGLLASAGDGSQTKRLHAGWAAQAGIVAADLARRGHTGPAEVLEGPNGFYGALLAGERADLDRVVRGLGSEWEVTRMAMKPHPACHFLHAFIDAAAGAGVKWGDVEEIVCYVAPQTVGIVCEPRALKLHPPTTHAAQFSLPFAVAAAIVGGREGLDLFGDDARADRRVLTLAERVRAVGDPTLPFPKTYGGRIEIHTRAGRTIEVEEMTNRGHPDRPLSDEEVASKFLHNATRRVDMGTAEKIFEAMWRLEELDSIEELTALTQTA